MKRKTIITLIVALFLSMTTTKVFATNNTIDSLNKESVGFTSASPNDTNNQVFPQQQIIAEKSINRENRHRGDFPWMGHTRVLAKDSSSQE